MKLGQLLEGIVEGAADVPAVEVKGVTSDSRQVREGFLYVGIRGGRHDGRDFVHDAEDRGAVACLVEGPEPFSNGVHIPVIVVPDFFAGVAEGYTHATDIRLYQKPHVTKVIRNLPVDIADAIKEMGCGKGRIGLESGQEGGMCVPRPINDIDKFRSELDGATFVDACDLIWKCRMIKSASEVEALRKASAAVVRAYGEVVSNFELRSFVSRGLPELRSSSGPYPPFRLPASQVFTFFSLVRIPTPNSTNTKRPRSRGVA